MPILMEPSSHSRAAFDMQSAASEDDEDDDYSFSLSELPEEESVVDPALHSRESEDSISFSFSTDNLSETAECGPFGFTTATLPRLHYAHGGAFESSSVCDKIMRLSVEDEENASLVPFKISGSWRAELSSCQSVRQAESRRSFSFSTDTENETEHSEELVIRSEGSSMVQDSALGGKHEEPDDDNMRAYSGTNQEGDDDSREVFGKHAHEDDDIDNIHAFARSSNSGNPDDGIHAECEHFKLSSKRAFSDPSKAALRFAGEGLLQPWSSSKLSKSCGQHRATNAEISESQSQLHSSHVSPKKMNYFHPLPSPPLNNNVDKKLTGICTANRMQSSSDSEPFSPRRTLFMKGGCSPTHTPIYMPTITRKTRSLFARRVEENAGETLSLLVNAQRPTPLFVEAAPSPPGTMSGNSSSYRTFSNGSTQSSGYSSSSGKSSVPNSRSSSRNVSVVSNTRCSLRQRMDADAPKLHRQGDPNAHLHRKD
eukprot:c7365_g1_i1 orf=156-1604(+)